ncbi:tape measure protein [Acinetobacter soli]|uniref:tape measure protein n=1 Tax=Acinetobacter soli TaxID=487316 RepID=UPI00125079E9|nr:tape measure protein [Acinetobacter soli]
MAASTSRLVIEISSEQAKRNAELLNRELQSIEKNGDFATKSMDAMSVATRSLAAQMTALVSVGALISKMDAYTNLQNRLKLVTNSQTELNKAMSDTFDIAQRTRQSWDAAAQVYQGFANNAKTLGLTMDQTAKLTETVSKAVAISGASAASAEAALVQFNQALGAGALRGEELNSVMEQTPALARAIAEGMGITVGQLRTVAATGAITSEALVKALEKASKSVDSLFAKTDPTIGQSFTMLNNEVSKFVGEAGKASGAASLTADSIKLLAENLDLVANSAAVVGIGVLTKTILAKSVAVRDSVVASVQNRAALLAENKAQVQALGVEALRTKQLVALSATEINLARAEYNAATSATARAAAVQRLTAAEVAHSIAKKEATVATNAYTVAQTRLNAVATLSSRALGLVGGPIGAITLGVTALAAGYMYFQDKAAKANEVLEEQAKVANKAASELRALKGLEKDKAVDDMTASIKRQNEALSESSSKINIQLDAIEQLYKGNSDVVKVVQDARNGTISMNDAVKKFNDIKISKEIYESFKANTTEFNKNSIAARQTQASLKIMGVEIKLTGNDAQTATAYHEAQAKALKSVGVEAAKASAELEKYKKQLQGDAFESLYKSGLLDKGYTSAQADAIYKLQQAKGLSAILSQQEIDNTLRTLKLNTDLTKQEKEKTEQIEKQVQLQLLNNKNLENGYRVYQAFLKAGLTSKQSLAFAAQVGREGDFKNSNLFGSHTDNNNGATNVGMLSWQGPRAKELLKDLRSKDLLNVDGTIKQVQEALDIQAKYAVQEFMTKKEYLPTRKAIMSGEEDYSKLSEVSGRNFVRWDFDGKKINANKHKQKESSYYQQLSNLVGMSSDGNSIKLDDYGADLEKLNQLKLQYDEKYYTDIKKRQVEHDKEISDYKLLYSGDELKAKIGQSNKQFEAENNLAKLQFEYQVNGWNWVGEERIKKEAEISKAVIDATIELNETQKAAKKKGIDEEAQYAIDVYNASIDQQLVSARSAYMGETELAVRRYQAELREIEKVRDAKIKAGLLDANKMGQFQAQNQASDNVFQVGFQASQDLYQRNSPQQYAQWDLQNQYSNESGNLESKYRDQVNGIDLIANQEERNSQLLAAHQQHLEAMAALDASYAKKEDDLRKAQMDVQLQSAQSIFGSLTDIAKNTAGENSGVYKAMFAMEKGMAIARSIMAIQTAIAEASANPFPYNLAAMATVASQTASIIATIKGVTMPAFATGGIFTGDGYVRGSGTETSDSINARLSNNEYVIKAKSVRSLGVDTLDYINRMGELPNREVNQFQAINSNPSNGTNIIEPRVNVNIQTLPGTTADVTQNSDGSLDVKIRKIIDEHVPSAMSNPSSRISKSMSQNYAIKRQR